MKRIKGRYVATVIINLDFPTNLPNLQSFDDMRKEVFENITPDIKEMIEDEINEMGTVEVHQQLADLYEVEVNGND